MKTITIFKPTYDDAAISIYVSSIDDARDLKMNYSKLRWYKDNLTRNNVEEAFHTLVSGVEAGVLHPAINVQAETLDEAFTLTNIYVTKCNNSVDLNWRHNQCVKITDFPIGRTDEDSQLAISSMSVGDIIHDGEKFYIVTPNNFLTY